jgi:antitoxin PrlF
MATVHRKTRPGGAREQAQRVLSSRVTSQGQVSVPAAVRSALGIVEGSSLEWVISDGEVRVRRRGRHATSEVHAALFPRAPRARSLEQIEDGIRASVRRRHAGD